jgi:hypothetical protein
MKPNRMKTNRKRTRSIKPTLNNTKKRKAYTSKKRTACKSMNKKYTNGGEHTPKTTLHRSSKPYGFPSSMPTKDSDNYFGFDDEDNCNIEQDPKLQPNKIRVCNTCIPYLKKIFILRYNELMVYINQIEHSIKTNYKHKIINDESFRIYSGFIEDLKKQCGDIYVKATDVNKTYNLEEWINYINRVGGKKGEIASRLDEQIYGVSIKNIGNVRKHKDKKQIPLPKSSKKSKTLRSLFGNRMTPAVRPVIDVLHRIEQ